MNSYPEPFETATQEPKGPARALFRHLIMQASPFGPAVHCIPLKEQSSVDGNHLGMCITYAGI